MISAGTDWTFLIAVLTALGGAGLTGVHTIQVALKPPLLDCQPSRLPGFGGPTYQPSPDAMERITQYQYGHWGEYGGMYVSTDSLVIAVTGHVDEYQRAYERLLNDPGHLKVIKVRYAQWQLRDLRDRIWNDRKQLQQLRITLWAISDDGIYQAVQLGVSDTTTRTRAILRDRYETAMFCIYRGAPAIPLSFAAAG